jgi:hypothetical protein
MSQQKMIKYSKNYLTETSAVLPAIAASTQSHTRHYFESVSDGQQFTSVYIRKEFLQTFFCELSYVAFFISQRSSVKDALVLLSQRYSTRAIKIDLIALGHILETGQAMNNSRVAAEEIGHLAVKWLKDFDRVFRKRVVNECGCQIGTKKPSIDYKTFLKDLNLFYEEFTIGVDECQVNDFVEIGNVHGKGGRIASDPKLQRIDSVINLSKLLDAGTRFVCKDCRKIGDVIIALEQPDSHCLVHLDKAFNVLCPLLNREHKSIKSPSAIDKEDRATVS